MNDLISREMALAIVEQNAFHEGREWVFRNRIMRQLEEAPAVEPVSQWISVKDSLPNEGEFVLILADSIQVARIIKGITEEERTRMRNGEIEDPPVLCWNTMEGYHNVPRSSLYGAADVKGNNTVPYSWKANGGPQTWFGQEVSHWMPLPEPPEDVNS